MIWVSERVHTGLHFILECLSESCFLHSFANVHQEDVSHNICPCVTAAYMLPQEKQGQRLSLCVYPEPVDERDGCEEGWGAKEWVGYERGSVAPVGLIVDSRLNGAGAGKVSAERGRRRRKYHGCMEGRYLTPHSTLCSEKIEEEEPP